MVGATIGYTCWASVPPLPQGRVMIQPVPVRVVEIYPAAVVPRVDLIRVVVHRVGPVGQVLVAGRPKISSNSVSVTRKA